MNTYEEGKKLSDNYLLGREAGMKTSSADQLIQAIDYFQVLTDRDRESFTRIKQTFGDGNVTMKDNTVESVPVPISPRDAVIRALAGAVQDLTFAYRSGVDANAMCGSVPVFQRMQDMQKELGTMMQTVSKMRGL